MRFLPAAFASFPVIGDYAILARMNIINQQSDSLDLSPDRLDGLHKRLLVWSERLRAAGLDGLVGAVLDAAGPLAPLGAQALWVAQPALGLLIASDDIDGLAKLLDSHQGLSWLRDELTRAEPAGDGNR